MGSGHDHGGGTKNEGRIAAALLLTLAFLIVEVIAGVLTQSLALISDAAHMFTDVAGLAVALAAIRIAKRPADTKRTFGYYRFEILASAFNAVLLFAVAIYILYEAYQRFQNPPEVHSVPMLIVAVVGLVVNFVSLRLLSGGKDQSLNVKGAYLEVWSDMLGSVGVIAAAAIIYFTGWTWVDSLVAVGIGLWVLPRTWELLKETTNILLQGVPRGLDVERIDAELKAIDGVTGIHSLHVWALTSGKNVVSAHIEITSMVGDQQSLRRMIEQMLHDRFGLAYATIQLEDTSGHGAIAHGGEDDHAHAPEDKA